MDSLTILTLASVQSCSSTTPSFAISAPSTYLSGIAGEAHPPASCSRSTGVPRLSQRPCSPVKRSPDKADSALQGSADPVLKGAGYGLLARPLHALQELGHIPQLLLGRGLPILEVHRPVLIVQRTGEQEKGPRSAIDARTQRINCSTDTEACQNRLAKKPHSWYLGLLERRPQPCSNCSAVESARSTGI